MKRRIYRQFEMHPTYTTANGKYTENIELFTKTPESVGKSLVLITHLLMEIGVINGKIYWWTFG
jgi:hypothetical protein